MTTCSWFLSNLSGSRIVTSSSHAPTRLPRVDRSTNRLILCTRSKWSNDFSKLLASFSGKVGRATSRDNLLCGSTRCRQTLLLFFFSRLSPPVDPADKRRWCNQRNISSIAHHLLPSYTGLCTLHTLQYNAVYMCIFCPKGYASSALNGGQRAPLIYPSTTPPPSKLFASHARISAYVDTAVFRRQC